MLSNVLLLAEFIKRNKKISTYFHRKFYKGMQDPLASNVMCCSVKHTVFLHIPELVYI